jgi:hypothetical protein
MNPLPLSNEQLQFKRELAQLDKQLVEFVAAARPLHEEERPRALRSRLARFHNLFGGREQRS